MRLVFLLGLAALALACSDRRSTPAVESAAPMAPTPAPPPAFAPTVSGETTPAEPAPAGMVWVPGGEFTMGALDPRDSPDGGHEAMEDARPLHRVLVDGFWMDKTEVTNREFGRFVAETRYVTIAERKPRSEDFPGAPPENLVAGSIVFTSPGHEVPLNDFYQWWRYVPGASWRHPGGPKSDLRGRDTFPVVQIAWEDATAFAAWAGKRLPTEAEFEFAARGGLSGQLYAWGNELRPKGAFMANTFQGRFPAQDSAEDRHRGISAVAQYPPNGYGLHDVAGNVWEWCQDWYRPDYYETLAAAGPVARNPRGPESSFDPSEPGQKKRVQRGGSFLCTDQYCTRYMVGTRGKGEPSSGTDHGGFRCVRPARRS